MRPTSLILAVAGLSLTAAACGNDTTSTATTAAATTVTTMVDKATDTTMAHEMTDTTMAHQMTDTTMAHQMTDTTAAGEMMLAPWQHLALTDVNGASFTLGDFVGKPVFVETFATWCPNCRAQLVDTDAAAATAGADAVFIALSIETDLSAKDVADYAAKNGYSHVRFAVMTPEFLAAISEAYGPSSINAPSTPHFVIDSHGTAGELTTGSEGVPAIVDALHSASM